MFVNYSPGLGGILQFRQRYVLGQSPTSQWTRKTIQGQVLGVRKRGLGPLVSKIEPPFDLNVMTVFIVKLPEQYNINFVFFLSYRQVEQDTKENYAKRANQWAKGLY
jgi:hypothetical protein